MIKLSIDEQTSKSSPQFQSIGHFLAGAIAKYRGESGIYKKTNSIDQAIRLNRRKLTVQVKINEQLWIG